MSEQQPLRGEKRERGGSGEGRRGNMGGQDGGRENERGKERKIREAGMEGRGGDLERDRQIVMKGRRKVKTGVESESIRSRASERARGGWEGGRAREPLRM